MLDRFHKALDGQNITPTASAGSTPRAVDSSTPHTGDQHEEVSPKVYDQVGAG